MSKKFRAIAAFALGVAAVAALSAATGRSSASIHAVSPMTQIGPHNMVVLGPVSDPAGQVGPLRVCQTTGVCYGPDQIQKAYGFDKLYAKGYDGTGRTIVIIDAYGSDTLNDDISAFNGYMGLPATDLQVVYPDGAPDATDPDNAFGWKAETTLDVTWAHAVAPGAKIVLVVSKSNNDSDILSATQWVANNNAGDVISQSYGEAEECMGTALLNQQHAVFKQLDKKHITLFASSGDQGAALPNCDGSGNGYFKRASTPATDPLVTAVGGTSLTAKPATSLADFGGDWQNEVTWNEGDLSSTGGGLSVYYPRPGYQGPVVKDSKMREVPDIAYNAGVTGGVLAALTCPAFVCGVDGQFFFRFGGTSAGSPQWAGLIAIADQKAHGRVGGINETLYHLGTRKGPNGAVKFFHDITVGDNSQPGLGITGFSAVPGWDAATGFGSPKADTLALEIAKPGN